MVFLSRVHAIQFIIIDLRDEPTLIFPLIIYSKSTIPFLFIVIVFPLYSKDANFEQSCYCMLYKLETSNHQNSQSDLI